MKIFEQNLTKIDSTFFSKYKGIVLYGNAETRSSLYIQTVLKNLNLLSPELKILKYSSQEFVENENILDQFINFSLFEGENKKVLYLTEAKDKCLTTIEYIFSYLEFTIIEAFHLPVSSKIIQWAIQSMSIAALPLYLNSTSSIPPTSLKMTPQQHSTARDLCEANQEPLAHFYSKLELFIYPEVTVSEILFKTFLELYPNPLSALPQILQETLQKSDSNAIGISRILFVDFLKGFTPSSSSFKKSHFFEGLEKLSSKKQRSLIEKFIQLEEKTMYHPQLANHLPFYIVNVFKTFTKR